MDDRITLAHGDGGLATHNLIKELFHPALANPALLRGGDSAMLELPGPGRIAMTTDSFVVSPVFFQGGDLGRLAVSGTVNDLAVAGARPLWLTAGFILEEGFLLENLKRIVRSMAETAAEAGVSVVTGDTKVVGRGQVDGCFINTSGVGLVAPGLDLGTHRIRPGMKIILSGPIGDHGVAVLSARAGLAFQTSVASDVAPVNHLAAAAIAAAPGLALMRDPTRGGVATALAEIAKDAGCDLLLDEAAVPARPEVTGACEMLGLDPLYLACEGRLLAFCPEVQPVEFGAPSAAKSINNVVEKATGSKIPTIVERTRPADRMYIVNAIYFYGSWKEPFEEEYTRPRAFHLATGAAKELPMMSQSGRFRYLKTDGFEAAVLPYGDGRVNLYLFVPDQGASLERFVQGTAERWDGWMKSLDAKQGRVTLPKIKLSYKAELIPTMARLGMGVAFSDSADFSNLFQGSKESMAITRITHKTFLEMNEKGTEAAAVTVVGLSATSAPVDSSFNLVADRPYFIAIRDDQTGALLFAGAIHDPASESAQSP